MSYTIPIDSASFAGHESFPLRFAWLKKGYDQIAQNPAFFGTTDAMVVLGTGKNMVRAIRHWGMACQIWQPVEGTRNRQMEPTEIGRRLFDDAGWDPYLEETGTIWLLHWLLVTNTTRGTTWSWVFGRPRANRFQRDEIIAELEGVVRELGVPRAPRSTLKRDVNVLLHSYVRSNKGKAAFAEDNLDSPFTLLNLIRPAPERGSYEIVQGPHLTLPTEVFEVALIQFCRHFRKRASQAVTLDELLYASFSPGRVFRLTEDALVDRLTKIVRDERDRFLFDETAGLRQVLIRGDLPSEIDVLERFYTAPSPRRANALGAPAF